MVQRDHEQKSQIVERQIRDDAALEEAKRKEQAVKEEKLRQKRARQEAEICFLRFVVSRDLFFCT
jgi:nucleoporin GLE1